MQVIAVAQSLSLSLIILYIIQAFTTVIKYVFNEAIQRSFVTSSKVTFWKKLYVFFNPINRKNNRPANRLSK